MSGLGVNGILYQFFHGTPHTGHHLKKQQVGNSCPLNARLFLSRDLVTWLLLSRCTVALGRAAKKTPSAIELALQHLLESRT